MNKEWEQLIDQIIAELSWGPVSIWQGGDFRKLSQLIFDKTHVNISESTLRRLFGKSDYPHIPNETTLNTLAVFAGYTSWRDFRSQRIQKPSRKFVLRKEILFAVPAILALLIIFVILYHPDDKATPVGDAYAFTSKTVTRAIPNSVIFHYKAPLKTAQLYIQQSWDNKTRVKVASDHDIYTSVYYRPGFYEAKLIVGNHVIKEHPLVIPTAGWLGLIYFKPAPYYLKPTEFIRKDRYEVTSKSFADRGFNLDHDLLRAELYNVGNFVPVPVADADFTAMVKTDSASGGDAYKRLHVFLVTNGVPVSLNICDKGCVSTLSFLNGKTLVSGKTTDLSGFGVTPGSWVKTEIRSTFGKLQYLVNNHIAYETSLPERSLKILGIAFGFDNGGAAKSILLKDRHKVVFQDR
ncbi:MAG TPA: hypothetical protein VGM63_23100 [Mucilaginibacter sp.]|jgi:hypothetical protein